MPKEPKDGLKAYRAEIRTAWLGKAVARKKLTSHETRLITRWFEQNIDARLIVQAIDRTVERAKQKSLPIYSIGLIAADLLAVQRERARMNVGSAPSNQERPGWREDMAECLIEIADYEAKTDPERAAMYRELLRDLPNLSREEVEIRGRQIRGVES